MNLLILGVVLPCGRGQDVISVMAFAGIVHGAKAPTPLGREASFPNHVFSPKVDDVYWWARQYPATDCKDEAEIFEPAA